MHWLKIIGITAAVIVAVIVACVIGLYRQINKNGYEQ